MLSLLFFPRMKHFYFATLFDGTGLRKFAGIGLFVVMLTILFLFSPQPKSKSDYCGDYFQLAPHIGFVVNCDAGGYVRAARFPNVLLNAGEVRQSRPLYALLGSVVGIPLEKLLLTVRPETDSRTPYYLGFVFLNHLLLIAAITLLLQITAQYNLPGHVLLVICCVLICNDVTKAFVWTAHQQMFSILTPILIVFSVSSLLKRHRSDGWHWLFASFVGGTFALMYGNFLVGLPILIASRLLVHFLARTSGEQSGIGLLVFAMVLLFLLPSLLWIVVTTQHAGYYYNHEIVVYRQLVWILDALRSGFAHFGTVLLSNTTKFIRTFQTVDILPVFVAFISVLIKDALALLNAKRLAGVAFPNPNPLSVVTLVGFVCFLVFFWLLGYYQERLTFTLVPFMLIYLCVRSADFFRTLPAKRSTFSTIAVVFSMCWVAFHVMKYGPFS